MFCHENKLVYGAEDKHLNVDEPFANENCK
jgi:hypothetical protein